METFISFLIASAVTLFFVRRYLKSMAAAKKPGSSTRVVEQKMSPCPRCSKPVVDGSSFCNSCGAALAMWNVHRAQVKESGAETGEAKGRPRPVINASLCIGCGSCVEACPETGTLEVLSGKAILAHPERCTGHAKCVDVCPTSAILLAFGNALQTIRVPQVNENFETNVPGVFIVGELGGMGLIKTAINEGKLVVDRLRQRVSDSQTRTEGEPYDLIIVGAGPAGLSASLTAHQYEMNYLTLEQGEIAATIRNYPRQKFLMAEPIEMPLYGSLYIGDGTKEALLSVWETIIANTGVKVHTGEGVTAIRRTNGWFQVESSKRAYAARHVVLAVGKRGTPRRLGVAGEELSKVAYKLIEAESYTDDDVLVVGGGDSAVEATLALSRSGKNRTTISYRGPDFKRIRERNKTLLEEAEAEGRVKVIRNSQVLEIRADSVLLDCEGSPMELRNGYVFVLAGGQSPEDFLRRTGVEIVEKVISG